MTKRLHTFLTGSVLVALTAAITGCMGSGGSGGTPTLRWDAPMTRVDGSKLYPGEIEGYRIYYRRSDESHFHSHFVDTPNQTSWSPTSLRNGTYNFAVSTVDTTGLESPRSETLRVSIP